MKPAWGMFILAVLLSGCASASHSGSTLDRPITSSSTCREWAAASATKRIQFAAREVSAIPVPTTISPGSEAAAYVFGYIGGHCARAEKAGNTNLTLAAAVGLSSPSAPTTTSPPDKVAPNPNARPTFTNTGKTEHGDTLREEGRFGPILTPSESDVDQSVLNSCAETNGRELVRRLDLTFTITSGLAGDVRVAPPTASVNEEEGAEAIRNLNFVVTGPEDTSCHKGLAEETGFTVDLGTLQPHQPRTLSVWVALINAITPADPHPSLKKLRSQEWSMTYPAASVDGALAVSGGGLSVTE